MTSLSRDLKNPNPATPHRRFGGLRRERPKIRTDPTSRGPNITRPSRSSMESIRPSNETTNLSSSWAKSNFTSPRDSISKIWVSPNLNFWTDLKFSRKRCLRICGGSGGQQIPRQGINRYQENRKGFRASNFHKAHTSWAQDLPTSQTWECKPPRLQPDLNLDHGHRHDPTPKIEEQIQGFVSPT